MIKVFLVKNKVSKDKSNLGLYIYKKVHEYLKEHYYPKDLLYERYMSQKKQIETELEKVSKQLLEAEKTEKKLMNEIQMLKQQNELIKNKILF